jgi:dihydrodipicolinate synthase/N-acetylneuraminate lyase
MSFKTLIKGPVIPIPTFFNKDESVNYDHLSNYVEYLSDSNIQTVMTTVGTSRYNLLSWEEIKLNNQALVRGCKNNTQSIVANPTTGGLKNTIEFGKHAQEIGADYFLIFFPERHYGEENTFNYFKTLNKELNIKLLIHEMPIRNGLGPGSNQYSIALLEKLFELENIIGLKEESLDPEYSNKIVEHFSNEYIIIGAGGGMSRYFFRDHERKALAYLGGIGNFKPELEIEFYNAMISGNINHAKDIVENIELKYFEKVVPLGWHPSLKIAIYLRGFGEIYERSPMVKLTNEQISFMQTTLKEFKLI